jgi:hypothetical protein
MNRIIICALAVLIAAGRTVITPRLTHIPSIEGSYEAAAHLVVGFLILVPAYDWHQKIGPSRLYGALGLALALWELGWFLAQKFA